MKLLKYIILFIFIYIYIYNPIFQILGFGLIKILLLISILYVLFKRTLFVNFIITFKQEIALTLLIATYAISTEMWGDNQGRMVAYKHIIWFLECFFIPIFFVAFFKDIFQSKNWENIIIFVGISASIITLFLIFNPGINAAIRSTVITDSLDVIGDSWDYRGFTIAEGSSYSYGIIQGLILSLCLLKIKENWLYILPILPLFISIIFNARIGLAPVAIVFVLMLLNKQFKIKYFLFISIIVIFGYWFVNDSFFAKQNSDSLEWGLSIFEDTNNFLSGNDNGSNYTTLSDNMLFFPDSAINIVFGEGNDVFLGVNRNSDMGYVIQIFRGGVFYLLLLLSFLWIIFKNSYLYAPNKILSILFVVTIIIVNIKGDAFFNSSSFFRLFIFYYIYSLSISKHRLNNIVID